MNTQTASLKEEVVAVLPTATKSGEKELSREITAIELEAESIVIESDEEYNNAAEFGRTLKRKSTEVTAFFSPIKKAANKTHREVCEREKIMLKPLLNAEKILKQTMGAYALEQERKRKALEDEMRRKAQEEAERKMEEAIKLDDQGDKKGAEAALLDAQMVDSLSRSASLTVDRPKAEGAYVSKDWEIVSINDSTVPLSIQGVGIRPVDRAAVMRLIRASKGKIIIPGVTYKETKKLSFRG